MNTIKFAFFGTGPLAESALYALYKNNFIPQVVVTKPDSKVGRGQILTAPKIKEWCDMKGIKVIQPESLRDETKSFDELKGMDVFIVASYGKIIPANILDYARCGTLNIHPSILPLYRGPSPIESQLRDGLNEIGVTIMKLDEQIDHGPLLIQTKIPVNDYDNASIMEIKAGQAGGELLSNILEAYIEGNLKLKEQEHDKATFTIKIEKENGLIDLVTPHEEVKRKWRAYTPWPGIYFMHKKGERIIRVIVNEIDMLATGNIYDIATYVTPEGKSKMSISDFKRGYMN